MSRRRSRLHRSLPELKYVVAPSGFLNCINFIAQHFPVGQPVVQMHDDVAQIYDLVSGKCVQTEDAHAVFVRVFQLMQKSECNLGGLYPMRNAMYMSQQKSIQRTCGSYMTPSRCCSTSRYHWNSHARTTTNGASDTINAMGVCFGIITPRSRLRTIRPMMRVVLVTDRRRTRCAMLRSSKKCFQSISHTLNKRRTVLLH